MTLHLNSRELPFDEEFLAKIDSHRQSVMQATVFLEKPISDASTIELNKLFCMSDFCIDISTKFPEFIHQTLTDDSLNENYSYLTYNQQLKLACRDVVSESDLSDALRCYRNKQMLRIAWRDMIRKIDVQIILRELSFLAEACICVTEEFLMSWMTQEHGQPMDEHGKPIKLVILAMGKLGAYELNFSSDIDLIFCFSEEGEVENNSGREPKRKPLSHSQYFLRLCQRLINLLNDTTAYGFVYRVDTRLRPFGDSGQLVLSFNAMEAYYERQGREWERYAMIKARAISADEQSAMEIMQRLHPFIYRRYLDFGAFASLRKMKVLIDDEEKRRGSLNNIKLGPGGIREIEFIGQAFQLIRGGRTPELQIRPILHVLTELNHLELLADHVFQVLIRSYKFLRRIENAIQAYADQQTHSLPDDNLQQQRLTFTMGYATWEMLLVDIKSCMQSVHEQFDQIFSAPQLEIFGSNGDEEAHQIEQLWQGTLDADTSASLLQNLGYANVENVLRLIESFQSGYIYKKISLNGRQRVDHLMPLLIAIAAGADNPDGCFLRLIRLVEAVSQRSAYIALLAEHPMGLSQLTSLLSKSEWISNLLVRSPILLDEILDSRRLYGVLHKNELEHELRTRLKITAGDVEQEMKGLSEFKLGNMLRVAASELNGVVAVEKVSDHLTYIAETVLQCVVNLASQHLQKRHGEPKYQVDAVSHTANFCVIAYGKLGGCELSFSSDLDLVFIHDSHGAVQQTNGNKTVDNALFFARVAQRIMHYLNTNTQDGVLYEVDTRLRPSGNAGVLVTNLQGFEAYQLNKAWTWEHQALIRARAITNNMEIKAQFQQIRLNIICMKRDAEALKKDVRDMRQRMRGQLHKTQSGVFDLKQSPGGITDIEFIIQYLVLAWANQHPELAEHTDNLRILESLVKNAILEKDDAKILADAYLLYRHISHKNTLQGLSGTLTKDTGLEDYQTKIDQVLRIWISLLG